MSAGKNFYAKQIDKALASAKEISQDEHPRIVVFSDCHRGNGTWNDSFLNNKTLFQAALGYYRENDFTYIELGDGDELWENRKFSDIEEIHADIFQQFLPFMLDGKMYMVWGNHDMVKSRKAPLSPSLPPCFPAVRICDGSGNIKFNLIHGHQVDPLNNQFWKAARWMVRYLWKPLELAHGGLGSGTRVKSDCRSHPPPDHSFGCRRLADEQRQILQQRLLCSPEHHHLP